MNHEDRLREYEQSLKEVVATRQGRFLMNCIIRKGNIGKPTMFTGNSTTFHNLGRHDLAAELMADIERLAPDEYLKMTTERVKES